MEKGTLSRSYLFIAYATIFCGYYILFLHQGLRIQGILGNFDSPTWEHIFLLSQPYLHQNWLHLFYKDFEPIFHVLTASVAYLIHFISNGTEQLDLSNAGALILSSAKLAEFVITKKILDDNVKLNTSESLFVTVLINFSTALYLPIINLHVDFPQRAANMLDSPTLELLTPLAVAFFYWYIKLYIRSETYNYKYTFIFALLLLIGTLIKESFTNIILVVMTIYYLSHPVRFRSKLFWHDFLIFTPSCIILLIEMHLIKTGFGGGVLTFAPFKVISYYSHHPVLNLLQGIEFPLLITFMYSLSKTLNDSEYLKLSWLFFIVAYSVFSLFSLESSIWPNTWTYANLAWSYDLALTFLFLFSIIAYVKLLYVKPITQPQTRSAKIVAEIFRTRDFSKIYNCLLDLGAINLGLVFFSGIVLIVTYYLGWPACDKIYPGMS